MIKYFLPLLAIVIFSCSQETESQQVSETIEPIEVIEETWLFKITLIDSVVLPLKVTSVKGDELNFTIHNAEETIALKNIHLKGDSIFNFPIDKNHIEISTLNMKNLNDFRAKFPALNDRDKFEINY